MSIHPLWSLTLYPLAVAFALGFAPWKADKRAMLELIIGCAVIAAAFYVALIVVR